jgi:laminin alpha 1/2
MNGRIHVWVDAGKGRVELESNLTLNDGEYHVISVSKAGRRFELRINDELQSTKTLSATPALVNMPEESGGLFLGGAPDFPEFDELSPTFIGLIGSIKNIVFNNRTISYDRALSFKNVHMGGDGPQMGGAAVQMMEPQKIFKDDQEGCQRVRFYIHYGSY